MTDPALRRRYPTLLAFLSRPRRKPFPAWYEKQAQPFYDPSASKKPRTFAPEWRYLSEPLLTQFAHYVLASRGNSFPFTIMLPEYHRNKAELAGNIKSGNAKRYIYERLRISFNKSLPNDSNPDYWFVMEVSDKRKNDIHVHGEIDMGEITLDNIDDGHAAAYEAGVRDALLYAFGPPEKRQLSIGKQANSGWVGYSLKDAGSTVLAFRVLCRLRGVKEENWRNDRLHITRRLNAAAHDLYDALREPSSVGLAKRWKQELAEWRAFSEAVAKPARKRAPGSVTKIGHAQTSS